MSMVYRAIALILFFLVYIVGLVGNGLLIFIVFRQKNLRTVPNLLVVSLALGDFLFVLFCVPFGAVAYSLDYYPFSTFYCRFENFIINLSLGVSVFSLLALSADRYKIIVKPFSSHANDPSIKLKSMVILIWVLSTLLALPETIYSGIITERFVQPTNRTIELIYCWSPNDRTLLANHPFMIARQISRLIIYYLFPLIFVSVFYILIAKHLFQTKSVISAPTTMPLFPENAAADKRSRPSAASLSIGKPRERSTSKSSIAKTLTEHIPNEKDEGGDEQQAVKVQSNGTSPARNPPVRSMTLDNEHLVSVEKSSTPALPAKSSSISLTNHLRRSKDLVGDNASIISNRNNMALHTLYRDVKTRKQLRARHKVAKTVLFLCSVFFICWLPKQIHDLYWFIGVLVYSARWNYFWQFNKTMALIFSYVYSCINPFALYFLSSTFRHFYKRYLFFWSDKSCCRASSSNDRDKYSQRRRTGDTITFTDCAHRSSINNASTIHYDLNRVRTSVYQQHQLAAGKLNRCTTADQISLGSATQANGTAEHLLSSNPT